MPDNPNPRLQTGDLASPDQLAIQQTTTDPYFRQPENQAGHQLGQLATALSALNPGLSNLASQYAANTTQRKVEAEQQRGVTDRQSIKDAMSAQKFAAQNRGTWTLARLKGYEMADAQTTANLYPAALQSTLMQKGLWNNENANPQDVASAMADVRQKFLQQGQGQGPDWAKTFSEYSSAHEDSVLNAWVQHTNQVREANAEMKIGNDGVTQVIAHAGLPTADEAAQRWNDYMDKSYTNTVLYPAQMQKLKTQIFTQAHAAALNSNNPELAGRIAAMFDKVNFKDDNGKPQYLAQTVPGGDASTEMHNALFYYNRQQKQMEAEDKASRIETLRDAALQAEKPYDGKMPSEIPAVMPEIKLPDGTDLRTEMNKMGMEPDRRWAMMREAGLAAKNQVRAQEESYAVDQLSQWNNKVRDAKTAGDLNDAKNALDQFKHDPAFQGATAQAHLAHFQDTLEAVESEFTPKGRDADRGYQSSKTDILRTARAYASEAAAQMRANNKDPLSAVGKFGTASLTEDGKGVEFTFGDIERQMLDSYNQQVDAVRGGRKFSDLTPDDYAKVGSTVASQYKPIFEKRKQQMQEDSQRQQRDEAEAQAAREKANQIKDLQTGRVIQLKGDDGMPTNAAVRNVLYTANSYGNTVHSLWRWSGITRGGWSGITTQADPFVIDMDIGGLRDLAAERTEPLWFFPASRKRIATDAIDKRMSELRYGVTPGGGVNSVTTHAFQSLAQDLHVMEGDDKLMAAFRDTAAVGSLRGYDPQVLAQYAHTRKTYLNLADEIGLPTGDRSYNPSWVDWRTTPLFSNVADVTDDNVSQLLKHLKLPDSEFKNLKAAQFVATEKRDERYGPIKP